MMTKRSRRIVRGAPESSLTRTLSVGACVFGCVGATVSDAHTHRPTYSHTRTRTDSGNNPLPPRYPRLPAPIRLLASASRFAFLALSLGLCPHSRAESLTLAHDGASDYVIVLPDPGAPVVAEADVVAQWIERRDALLREIGELVQSAFAANGAELAIVTESDLPPGAPGIYLGNTRFARAAGIDLDALEGWSYVHRAVGRNVIIAGRDVPNPAVANLSNRPTRVELGLHTGTLKGVADFLRDYVGTRFLYPGGETGIEFLPSPRIRVPASLDRRVSPALHYHAPGGYYRTHGVLTLTEALYLVANNYFPITQIDYRTHRYIHAVPAARYGESNPEYFALINDQRSPGHHLCLAHPDVRELIYRNVVESIDLGYAFTTLSQQDGFRPCQCPDCQALYDTGDDWGEKLWAFHLELAERLLKDRPHARIMLSAYGPTLNPPKRRQVFPDNVGVELSFYVDPERLYETWRPVDVPGGYHAFLYLFGRRTSMFMNPQNTPRRVAQMVRDYHAVNVHSIYNDGFGQGMGIKGPIYYVLGRMWDDPQQLRTKDLLEEYYTAAFREAVDPMRTFFTTLFEALEPYRLNEVAYTDPDGTPLINVPRERVMEAMRTVYPVDVLNVLRQSLAAAESQAHAPKVVRRLGLLRLEFDFLDHMATVAHLHAAFESDPAFETRERLLEAIEAWNAWGDTIFTDTDVGSMRRDVVHDWPQARPFRGYSRGLVTRWRQMGRTPLAWDIAAVRRAPLPGVQTLRVMATPESMPPDAPGWTNAPEVRLHWVPTPDDPQSDPPAPVLRMAFDGNRLYLRVEASAPIDADTTWDVLLDPFGDRTRYYRFSATADPASRREAAFGFITENVHPLFGQEDPNWQGDWEVRIDGRVAWMAIALESIEVDTPGEAAIWRGNVALRGDARQWLWSSGPGTRDVTDLDHVGELHFGEPQAAVPDGPHPVTALRHRVYEQTFRLPDAWTDLPDLFTALPETWQFRADPDDQGVEAGWHRPDFTPDAAWTPIPVPAFWGETSVGHYLGYGWYRTPFRLPAETEGKTLRLLFGGVDERAWVYVNGRLVDEPAPGRLWSSPFHVDVPAERLQPNTDNLLAVRVHASRGNAGIWRPVLTQWVTPDP